MILKSENSDHVIVGLRIKVDTGTKVTPQISFKLMNRVVKFMGKGPAWYDVALCDAEILYGALN